MKRIRKNVIIEMLELHKFLSMSMYLSVFFLASLLLFDIIMGL